MQCSSEKREEPQQEIHRSLFPFSGNCESDYIYLWVNPNLAKIHLESGLFCRVWQLIKGNLTCSLCKVEPATLFLCAPTCPPFVSLVERFMRQTKAFTSLSLWQVEAMWPLYSAWLLCLTNSQAKLREKICNESTRVERRWRLISPHPSRIG